MRRHKAIARVECVSNSLYTIKFVPGGYYHGQFANGRLAALYTGARKQPAASAIVEKFRSRAECAYQDYIKVTPNK